MDNQRSLSCSSRSSADRSDAAVEQQGFTTEDILWALGIWSVILCLSPVIVFYMLMVALNVPARLVATIAHANA